MKLENQIFKGDLIKILDTYSHEFNDFSEFLAKKYHRDNQLSRHGEFCDLEGIFLYCLIRHFKPNLIFEISPDTGMSTNYILQALKKNKKGKVFGFELEPIKYNNQPTINSIKNNQVDPNLLDKYYELVLGDATKTCKIEEYGNPDIVLIDSCHDDWFCDWYIKEILPEVNCCTLIQDISYKHRPEGSTEAKRLIKYIGNNQKFFLVDNFREWFLLKDRHFPIRNFLSNSILLGGKDYSLQSEDKFISNDFLKDKIDKNILKANKGFLLNNSFPGGFSQFAPRYIALCLSFEEDKFVKRWLRDLLIGSLYISRSRYKDVRYSITHLLQSRKLDIFFLMTLFKIFRSFPIFFIKSIFKISKEKFLKMPNLKYE